MPRIRRGRAVFLLVGLLAAGFFGLTWIRYQREIRRERERVSTGSGIARTPCGPIEYAVAGDGPPVLLVHGAGGGFDQGLEFGAPLARSGLRVIAMSRFGYLRTPLPALRSDFLFWAAIRLARPVVIRAILATPPEVVKNADASEQARVGELLRRILPVSPRRLGLQNDAAVTSSLPRYELERITAPMLVISMADDLFGTFDGARYTAEHVPGARFTGYPTGGHVWAGHQKEIVAEIATFLK